MTAPAGRRYLLPAFSIFHKYIPLLFSNLCHIFKIWPQVIDKWILSEYTCAKFKGTKPMTQTSRQNESLPESRRRWDGGREDFAEWTAEGGLNGAFPSKYRRAFPPLPRKDVCWHVAERTSDRQFGWHRRSFQTFVPKEPLEWVLEGWRSFFFASFPAGPPERERSNYDDHRKKPLQDLFV